MVWECVQWLVRNTSESIIMKLKKLILLLIKDNLHIIILPLN